MGPPPRPKSLATHELGLVAGLRLPGQTWGVCWIPEAERKHKGPHLGP